MSGRPRAVVDGLPQYKPGKSAAQAAADHQLVEAIKLASNESSYGPLPSVLEAVADSANLLNRYPCLLYTSPSPRDVEESRMPSSA